MPIACLLLSASLASAGERTFDVTPGSAAEAYFLHGGDSRVLTDIPTEGPYRNVDGAREAIYRFDTLGARSARVVLHMGNNFRVEVSSDGEQFTEVLRNTDYAQGLSNLGEYAIDLTGRLPAERIYLKLSHGWRDRGHGFGACLFDLRFTVDDDRTLPLTIARRLDTPPEIDGNLDEPVWREGQRLATFSDRFGRGPVGAQTWASVAYSDESLYFGFVCFSRMIAGQRGAVTEHDGAVYTEACVEMLIQPPGAGTYYHLAVNSLGTTFDEVRTEGGPSWEPSVRAASVVQDIFWQAEVAIPLADLGGGAPSPDEPWRVGLYRIDPPTAQHQNWSCVEGSGWHTPERFGFLHFALDSEPLPAANIVLPAELHPGAISGQIELTNPRAGDRLKLSVLPELGPAIITDHPLPADASAVVADVPILDYGRGYVVAELLDAPGAVVNRAALPYSVDKADVLPLEVTLAEPYCRDVDDARAWVTVNLADEDAANARLRVSTISAGEPAHQSDHPAEAGTHRMPIDLTDLPVGEHTVTFALLDADGAEIAAESRAIHTVEPGPNPSRVTIDERNVTHVNGEPFLPLGHLLVHTGEGTLDARREFTEAGYNVQVFPGKDDAGTMRALDEAAEMGAMVMLEICEPVRAHELDRLRPIVSRFRDHPALLGWYAADEPEGYGNTIEELERAYGIIREVDPAHPVAALTNAPGMFRFYDGICDVAMADPYPIPGHALSLVADWTDAAREGLGDSKPIWMTPQGFGWKEIGGDRGDPPTDAEFRNMMYQSLVHGAKGIVWWPWSVPYYNHRDVFVKLAREVTELRDLFLFGESIEGPTVVNGVHYRTWSHDGAITLIAVNTTREPQTLSLTLNATEAAVLFEDRTLPIPNGRLTLSLAPAATHILRLGQ